MINRDELRANNPLTREFFADQCLGEAYAVCTLGTEQVSMDVDYALVAFCHLNDSKLFELAANAPDGKTAIIVSSELARTEIDAVWALCEAREQGV